jgi:hypothetical protein
LLTGGANNNALLTATIRLRDEAYFHGAQKWCITNAICTGMDNYQVNAGM